MMHEELVGLVPEPEVSRRSFIVTSLAAGFALAVEPVCARTALSGLKGDAAARRGVSGA